jgi:hypothetical protein
MFGNGRGEALFFNAPSEISNVRNACLVSKLKETQRAHPRRARQEEVMQGREMSLLGRAFRGQRSWECSGV